MAYSYPHTESFDSNEKVLTFEDGFEITVPAGAFSEAVDLTIDKEDSQETEDGQPVTAAYTFSVDSGPPPELGKELMLRVPMMVHVTVGTALTLHDRDPGEEFPNPDDWTPKPEIGVDQRDGLLEAKLSELRPFQIIKEE